MKNKNVIITILIVVITAGVGFFAGFKYQQLRRITTFGQFNGQGVQRMGNVQNRNGFRPVNGEIISADDKSITVKLTDGSSKIVLLSENTQINKAASATKTDLKVGEKVLVTGTNNSDGSVAAQNIQLNPMVNSNPVQINQP